LTFCASIEPNESLSILPNLLFCFHTFIVLNLEQRGSRTRDNDPSAKLKIRVHIPRIITLLPKIKYGLPYRENIPMNNNKWTHVLEKIVQYKNESKYLLSNGLPYRGKWPNTKEN